MDPNPHHSTLTAAPAPGLPHGWSTREAQAQAQIGHTAISRPVALFLAIAFGATLLVELAVAHGVALRQYMAGVPGHTHPLPPAYDLFRNAGATASAMRWAARQEADPFSGALAANAVLTAELHRRETQIAESSALAAAWRPHVQGLLGDLGAGGRQVYVGRAGWLFYRPEVDGLIRPAAPTDMATALLQAHASLQRRGIRLVVMPIPSKPMVHPEYFARGPWPAEILENGAGPQWRAALTAQGLTIVDSAALMLAGKCQGQIQFLQRDTHWRPEVMERCAHALADCVRQSAPSAPAPTLSYRRTVARVANAGDLAAMLALPPNHPLGRPESVTIHPVCTSDGTPWRPVASAQILLLGDSYTNIYSDEVLGWGAHAGLAPQLALELQCPIDVLAVNGSGRDMLQLLQAPPTAPEAGRLAGKKVVIWQVAIRTLTDEVPTPE